MLGLDGDQDFEKACIARGTSPARGDWRRRCFMLGLGDERVTPSPVLPSERCHATTCGGYFARTM